MTMYSEHVFRRNAKQREKVKAAGIQQRTPLATRPARARASALDNICQYRWHSSFPHGKPSHSGYLAVMGVAIEKDLGNRIRKARRLAGMTQAALAERLGVSRSAVANWESATGIWPASARLLSIATRTGVSYEWLATGRGVVDESDDMIAVIGELVDDPHELRLLHAFRNCRSTIRRALVELAEKQRHRP